MTRNQMNAVEDAIVSCIEDDGLTFDEMLEYIVETYKVSPPMVKQKYLEMYGE